MVAFVQKVGNFTSYVDFEMTAKFWGEEKETDAIYAVYLRKVRYRPPTDYNGITSYWIPGSDYKSNGSLAAYDVDHLQWETVKERVLKAGTLQRLVNALVLPGGEIDSRHFNVFFATYRAFSKASEVLRALLAEVHVVLSDKDKLPKNQFDTILRTWHNILLWWLDLYPDDFRDHPHYQCLTHVIEFTRVQQGIFQDLFIKAVRLRDDFCRALNNPNASQHSLDKFLLISPNEGLDSYVLNPRTSKSPDITHVDPNYVAEQLTYWDAEIFKRLIPHQCQSCFWSRRNKNNNASNVYSVKATIEQFNSVSRRVMSTVVHLLHVKTSYRARVISTWIDIAQELRILKNFSSLKAVLSGLQSEPVYRLKSVWALVSTEKVKEFNELSRLFSEDDNYNGARSLLEKEGTAKVVNINDATKEKHAKHHFRHRRAKSEMNEIQGTVPYLGTFLTDLTMIDSAHADFVESGLINFEKRRKEFDIIAQLRLFQSAARSYRLTTDSKFRTWFLSLPTLSEQHCYHCSCLIERPNMSTPIFTKEKRIGTWSKFLNFWEDDQSGGDAKVSPVLQTSYTIPQMATTPLTPHSTMSFGRSVFYDQSQFSPEMLWNEFFKNGSSPTSTDTSSDFTKNGSVSRLHSSASIPSIVNLSSSPKVYASNNCNNNNGKSSPLVFDHRKQVSNGDDCYVIRVYLDDSLQLDPSNTTLYKCVKLENSDKTSKLIEKVIQKHQITEDPSHFSIVQMLPDGDELVLPERGNAYYAVSRCEEMNFVLRKKSDVPPATLRVKKKRRKNIGSSMFRWSSGFL